MTPQHTRDGMASKQRTGRNRQSLRASWFRALPQLMPLHPLLCFEGTRGEPKGALSHNQQHLPHSQALSPLSPAPQHIIRGAMGRTMRGCCAMAGAGGRHKALSLHWDRTGAMAGSRTLLLS